MEKINRTFFDHVSFTAVERIHSAILVWIFNLGKEYVSDTEKSQMIKKMFKIPGRKNYSGFIAFAEVNKIDILIESEQGIFALENKLKSSEHSDQTNTMPDNIKKVITDKRPIFYGFLTLIDEKARNKNFKPLTYKKLAIILSELHLIRSKDSHKACIIREFIVEYLKTLDNLNLILKNFLKKPSAFVNIFDEGGLTKFEKFNKYREKEHPYDITANDYIRQNQLETIFQKAFMLQLGKQLKLKKGETYKTDESHGTGLLQVYLKNYSYNKRIYQIGLQLQGKTLKINLADKFYNKSSGNQINNHILRNFKKVFARKDGYGDINKPKKTKKSQGKAYISVTKKLPKELYEYSRHELLDVLESNIKYLRKSLTTYTI